MARKGFVPWLAGVCLLFAVGYFVAAPQRVAATVNCCVFPTQEEAAAVGWGSGNYTQSALFLMTLSDPQGTDFASSYPDESGEVGEYNWAPGTDGCYNEALQDNEPVPPGYVPFTSVGTPFPFYWTVGGSAGYNKFGYDEVGYSDASVNLFRGFGMPLPCAATIFQGMQNLCNVTGFWRSYSLNYLYPEIYSTYVVICKDSTNSVCVSN